MTKWMRCMLVSAVLAGCGDNETAVGEDAPEHGWNFQPPTDLGTPDAPPAPDVPESEPDATQEPDASEPTPDASEPDAAPPAPDAAPACDDASCLPAYGYCAEDGTCTPWPPIPPPETWACYREGHDNLGCCVSTCQKICDADVPDSLFTACQNSCELRCKEILDR